MTLSLVETYCLRSIITIANEVSSSMSANTPDSDNSILIISSSIKYIWLWFYKQFYSLLTFFQPGCLCRLCLGYLAFQIQLLLGLFVSCRAS